MIPRLKPFLSKAELLAVLRPERNSVARFEQAFAAKFEAQHALAFSYGRSALWAFFKAFEIENAEIIMPAYTCVVVAHAAVLSGNMPRFVDINLADYNMNLEDVESAINENTRAILATHLFGYPLNVDRLNQIVRAAEKRFGHKIWVIQDCAHSFGARWQGKLVCNTGDLALFGLNISKVITSVFGGMITTNDPEVYERLSSFRTKNYREPGVTKSLRRFFYLLAVYPAFNNFVYSLVYWLQEKTPFLNHLTKAYHLDEQIRFPPDHLDQMTNLEARVGLVQLTKYDEIVRRRQETAAFYDKHLPSSVDINLPPIIHGATYSHYVIRVPNRHQIMDAMGRQGVQLGQLIEYSIPDMASYRSGLKEEDFPNALSCSRTTINFPLYAELSDRERKCIVRKMIDEVK